jgi:hypothetical protein
MLYGSMTRSSDRVGLHAVATDIAMCMYHTGLDPFTGEEVHTAKHLSEDMKNTTTVRL